MKEPVIFDGKLNEWKQQDSILFKNGNNDLVCYTGWVIEMAVPWVRLEIKPENNLSIGFDIVNDDQELETGYTTLASWAGNEANKINNPSEWGNLILVQETAFFSKYWGILLLIPIVFTESVFFFIKHKSIEAKNKPEITLSRRGELGYKAEIYILENYKDLSLNRDKVAAHISISKGYLTMIFKKNTDKTFPFYLNELRIAEAKKLLLNTEKNITEIAYEIGFSSLEHFTKTFKEFEKLTPGNFRKT